MTLSSAGAGAAEDGQSVADFDAVVIGAGFAGIYMVHRLRDLGLSVHGFEAGDGVGGTWYWNRYPGARCDSESMYYKYSFLPEVEQAWPLTERYPGQPEILRYLEHVAAHLDVIKEFSFSTRIAGVVYDSDARRWTVRLPQGGFATATFVVTAVGCLSAPAKPMFDGADAFEGTVLYTSSWPQEPVDLRAQRVGVIGTGSSGVQAIPVIAEQAAHVTVFQRTPQFCLPAVNGPLDPEFVDLWKANYPEWHRRARSSPTGHPYTPSSALATEASPTERARTYESGWEQGGLTFAFGTFADIMVDEAANQTAADFIRSKIDEIVDDPAVADLLKPRGYPFGGKRPPLGTNYYATFNRPNVTLVDVSRSPIEAITPTGIKTSEREYPLDVIVCATGFDALTGPLLALGLRGREGRPLEQQWANGPCTYLGVAVPGFPNLFTITGPGSPSVLGNVPVSIEQHVDWITDCIAHARAEGIETIEATEEAAAAWTDHVQVVAGMTLLANVDSWYTGANIPGKPRVFLPYFGGVGNYRLHCDGIAARGYEGFQLKEVQEHGLG